MKLLAPVNNYEAAIKQIGAGATEIYLGGDTPVFENLSFSGRGRFTAAGNKICPGFEEVSEIVKLAHVRGAEVMYTANIPFLANDPGGGDVYLKHFYNYVCEGLKAGVDSIVVGDIGALMFIRNEGIKSHLTASAFFETTTIEQVAFLAELGADRVVLSYQLTLDEIIKISQKAKVQLEVFGHFGCSFYDDCNLKHNYGETEAHRIGTPCRNKYCLYEGQIILQEGYFLNASLACSMCSVLALSEQGIYALKLVGRDLDMDQNIQITKVYSQLLEAVQSNHLDKTAFDKLRKSLLPEWWKRIWCQNKQCKYQKNQITSSYVGLE